MTSDKQSGYFRLLSIGLIAIGLNGCFGPPAAPPVTTEGPHGPVTVAALATENTDTDTWVAKPKPALAPEKIYPAPSRLPGMNDKQVIVLLGEPKFERRDDPALIWQYRTQTCALDLFLYRSAAGADYRVDHFETRNREPGAVSETDCFVGLLKAHEQRQAG
ncbi:MAG: hypothetical protein HQ494_16285 [Rhodospirillales bacterium]|nr:hypothetical protein [Rhodospirillales bacterium]